MRKRQQATRVPLTAGMAACVCMAAGVGSRAWAHAGHEHGESAGFSGPSNWDELWRAWEWDPVVLIPLALSCTLYAAGVRRMWKKAGTGRGVTTFDALCFASGWLTLVFALVSPIHQWGGVLFSVHMTQHELLMLVAAPLLVLARPLTPMLVALPARWRNRLIRFSRRPAWVRVWGFLSHALVAWLVHAVVLWAWHIPVLFEAALHSDLVHAFQHLGFVATAVLFWWSVVYGRRRAVEFGLAVLYMFTTAMHSGFLAALITFASAVWYPTYEARTWTWGVAPLEDQQLGGLIMWVPACLMYIFAGLLLFAAWLRESESRVSRFESELRVAGFLAAPVPERSRN